MLRKLQRCQGLRSVSPFTQQRAVKRVRTDAKADNALVSVGGWEELPGRSTRDARWFYLELAPANASWVFAGGEPYRIIATLELLATLLAVIIFIPITVDNDDAERDVFFEFAASTDNQVNSVSVVKLVSTKFPLCTLVIELSVQLQQRNAALELLWIPREQNTSADAIMNKDFGELDAPKRLDVTLGTLKFNILHELLELGGKLYEVIGKEKKKRPILTPRVSSTKKIKISDPW